MKGESQLGWSDWSSWLALNAVRAPTLAVGTGTRLIATAYKKRRKRKGRRSLDTLNKQLSSHFLLQCSPSWAGEHAAGCHGNEEEVKSESDRSGRRRAAEQATEEEGEGPPAGVAADGTMSDCGSVSSAEMGMLLFSVEFAGRVGQGTREETPVDQAVSASLCSVQAACERGCSGKAGEVGMGRTLLIEGRSRLESVL